MDSLPHRSHDDLDINNVFLQGGFEIIDNAMLYSFRLKDSEHSEPIVTFKVNALTCIHVQMIRLSNPANTVKIQVHFIDGSD